MNYPRLSPGPKLQDVRAMRLLASSLFCLTLSSRARESPGYDLSLGAEVRGGTLKLAPISRAGGREAADTT